MGSIKNNNVVIEVSNVSNTTITWLKSNFKEPNRT